MSSTLASLRDRVEAYLQDSTNLVFDVNTLEECIRLAMADYSMSTGVAHTLAGLDGAAATTLPAIHDSVIVIGSAGYTITSRAIKRAESYQMSQKVPKEVTEWGWERLNQFSRLLEKVRLGTFRVSTAQPWAAAGWLMDQWDGT